MKKFLSVVLIVFFLIGCSSDDSEQSPVIDNENQDQDQGDNSTTTTSFVPCENGMADIYPCSGYDLLAKITLAGFGSAFSNDIWGWTDATTGKEYAILGLEEGTAFIDISDTENLIYLGKLPTATVSKIWRDIKVYNNHAFIVSEAEDHGMQVFDLTRLRDVANPPETFSHDAHYTGFGNAHNIVINEATGFAYPVGSNTFNGGAHFINIQDPKNPVAAGGHAANGYTHDAQVITYNGPDADYSGKEIYIGSNEDQVAIIDITDKQNPAEISTITYSNTEYTHAGLLMTITILL